MNSCRRRLVAGVLVVLVAQLLLAGSAWAHTGFEASDPSDGATLNAPVDVITITFTGQAEPTGEGFQLLDPAGQLRQPTAATTADGLVWVLRFDPPVEGGVSGVRWTVKAPDAHPIDGSFSFTVDVPVQAPVEPAPVAQPPVAREPVEQQVVVDDAPSQLEQFLDTDDDPTRTPRRIGAAGRVLSLVGTLVGVGGLIFAAAVLRGDRTDVRHVLHWVRRAGVLVVTGALVELVAQVALEGGGKWSELWSVSALGAVISSSFGIAVVLRVVGGVGLASGARIDIANATDASDPVVAIRELVGVGAASRHEVATSDSQAPRHGRPVSVGEPYVHQGDEAWLPTMASAGAMFGAVALLAAHLFDGHTVTKGNRVFTGLVDLVHVAGGAVWAGGVMMLATVLWRRHRQGRELRALQLAIRFSVVATIALVAVGLAGLALAVIILDSPSELWATEWGRILIAKATFVAVAAAAGGYNHRVLIPQMNRAPDDPSLAWKFRSIVTGEAAALGIVLVLTAFLMGAAS